MLPGVTVSAVNPETNVSRTEISDETGLYLIRGLVPGTYTVTAEHPGFKKYLHTDIVLQVNQAARIDIVLQVGEISETVSVVGEAPLLETQTQERGEVIIEKQMTELPLNGRNYLQLAHLSVGVVSGKNNYGMEVPNINGNRVFDVGYVLDGGDNTDFYFMRPATKPSVDSLKEFKIMTTGYGAEYGRAMGGIINAVMKTGTNDFHGGVFEFLRNDKLDAANFFANRAGLGKPAFRQNQFGATLGGPLKRDRTFFFFAYDGTRIREQRIRSAIVPDAAQRAGDFSGSTTGIYDPLALDETGQRIPFPGNRIPASRMHSIAQKMLPYWPEANQPGLPNFTRSLSALRDENQVLVRVDHKLSGHDDFFARFSYQSNPQFEPGFLPGFGDDLSSKSFHAALNWTRSFGPTFINEISLSGLHNRPLTIPEHAGKEFNFGFVNDGMLPKNRKVFQALASRDIKVLAEHEGEIPQRSTMSATTSLSKKGNTC